MLIRSNAGEVARRLRRFQDGLPGAIATAAGPKYWKPRLELAATKTLRSLWALERDMALRELYERLTPLIVQTIVGEVFIGGVNYSLRLPTIEGDSGFLLKAALFNLGIRTPTGRTKRSAVMEEENIQHLEEVRQVILDWVKLEKHRDPERDAHADGSPLSDEEIAERIMEILGVNASASPRGRTPEMDAAAEGLRGAIERWMDGEGDTPPVASQPSAEAPNSKHQTPKLKKEVMEQWFTAVLLSWSSLFQSELPHRVKEEVGKLWKRCEGEMI